MKHKKKSSSKKSFGHSRRLNRLFVYTFLVVVGVASGCSYFEKKGDMPPNVGFRPVAAATSNIVPVPLEIAQDIQRISAGENYNAVSENLNGSPPLLAGGTPLPSATGLPNKESPIKEALIKGSANRSVSSNRGGPAHSYKVKLGDTLMKIAFENYGNLYRWREIFNANRDKVRGFNFLAVGTVLQIQGSEYVVIERNGNPYLIKRNDTLLKISSSLYGSSDYWKDLWANNRQLIHDPNQIYYGFTMYYRDVLDMKKESRVPATRR